MYMVANVIIKTTDCAEYRQVVEFGATLDN